MTADFESWPLLEEPFDAVVSATAFHWIDPAMRMAKAADALRSDGALAVVRSQHVMGGTEEFFVEVQRCYERFDPGRRGQRNTGSRIVRQPPSGSRSRLDYTFSVVRCPLAGIWRVP